jgi:hypothetical protein
LIDFEIGVAMRFIRPLALAVAATALAVFGGGLPAQADRYIPPPASGDVITLVPNSGWSGQVQECVSVSGNRTDNFAPVVQANCNRTSNQQWRIGYATTANDTYWLQNVHSGKCLEDTNYSLANGAPTGQYDCYIGDNQRWRLIWDDQNGYALFQNVYSGLCLSVNGWTATSGVAIVQNRCYSTFANEQFVPLY